MPLSFDGLLHRIQLVCVYDHNERVTSLIELLNQMNKTSINQVASASNGKGKTDL